MAYVKFWKDKWKEEEKLKKKLVAWGHKRIKGIFLDSS